MLFTFKNRAPLMHSWTVSINPRLPFVPCGLCFIRAFSLFQLIVLDIRFMLLCTYMQPQGTSSTITTICFLKQYLLLIGSVKSAWQLNARDTCSCQRNRTPIPLLSQSNTSHIRILIVCCFGPRIKNIFKECTWNINFINILCLHVTFKK